MKCYEYCYLSPVGWLKLITNEAAVLGIEFVSSPEDDRCIESFPNVMKNAVNELTLYFSGKLKTFSVSVYQEASSFRQRVYSELIKIGYGETISYKELAARVGSAKAVRAVGGANHNNKIPIIVPCHRVIGANGSLTGYRGGISVKEQLLKLEGALPR